MNGIYTKRFLSCLSCPSPLNLFYDEQLLKDNGFRLILFCKPDSHPMLYETMAFLAANQALPAYSVRRWNGRYGAH